MTHEYDDLTGAEKEKFLGIWKVTEIVPGSIPIEYQWAVCGKRIALFQFDKGTVKAFTQDAFSQESYEQFDLAYTSNKTLYGKSADGSVELTVAFKQGKDNPDIAFRFEPVNLEKTCDDGGGWDGQMGGD